jgi:NAD(P)-dependent dehydrogenase (short-subunit alcohol dehydrogenase family)
MSRLLITGSNRGLGLEWVRQCAGRGWRVFATCGDPDKAMDLRDLAEQMPSVSLHRLDVTDAGQASDLAEDLRGETIDLLVNNAGACFDTHISALPAIVSEVAEVKPHKRKRLRVLARERRALLEALERTGLILAHHW